MASTINPMKAFVRSSKSLSWIKTVFWKCGNLRSLLQLIRALGSRFGWYHKRMRIQTINNFYDVLDECTRTMNDKEWLLPHLCVPQGVQQGYYTAQECHCWQWHQKTIHSYKFIVLGDILQFERLVLVCL